MLNGQRIVPHYDARTIIFHWLTALLVLGQWCGAHAIDWFARGWPRTDARSVHIVVGALLAILIGCRLLWRWSGGRRLPNSDVGLLRIAASLMHGVLYGLLLITILLGLLNAWFHGDSLFGLYTLPKPSFVSGALGRRIAGLHELSANVILVMAALHTSAAVWRHYCRRDGLLSHMIPCLDAES